MKIAHYYLSQKYPFDSENKHPYLLARHVGTSIVGGGKEPLTPARLLTVLFRSGR